MRPAVETMEALVTRVVRQLSQLDRRPGPASSVRPQTVAAVESAGVLPPDAAPHAAFLLIDTGAVVVRTVDGWSEHDSGGVPWTVGSYLRSTP